MPERIIATFSAVFIVRRAAHARACGTRNAAYVGENQQVSRQEILRRRNAAGRSAACEAFPGVADTDAVRLEAAQFLFLSSLFVFSMTGPATKAARSARAIPLQPRPSRCRPPTVRRSACPCGSRGRNANASAGHVREDHQLFNTPSGKRFGNLLIAPDVVEPLPRAAACRRSGTGGRRSRIRHKCRPRKASRSRHARVPEKGPVEGAPVRTLYCSRYGAGLQTGRAARPCVRRRPGRTDRCPFVSFDGELAPEITHQVGRRHHTPPCRRSESEGQAYVASPQKGSAPRASGR